MPEADGNGTREPRMLTTDLALRFDPIYEPISRRFQEDPAAFADAFARAWFKLTHRDMGPVVRYLGPEVPAEELIWQDPVPAVDHELVDESDVASLKSQILDSGLTVSQLVSTAWASASTFRGSDKRGGANGARIRLEPQSGWEVNNPDQLATVLRTLEGIQQSFNAGGEEDLARRPDRPGRRRGRGEGGGRRRHPGRRCPFTPGRTDASAEQTDVESFAHMEPKADGFRNYIGKGVRLPAEYLLVDKANLLTLSAPQMTVLVGGLRVLGANYDGSKLGVFTDTPGTLTNDFFVNLLDYDTTWTPTSEDESSFEGRAADGTVRWTGTRADLVFGSNSELRAVAEVYASDDAKEKFVTRLRRGVGQGDEPRPVRSRLITTGAPGQPGWPGASVMSGGAGREKGYFYQTHQFRAPRCSDEGHAASLQAFLSQLRRYRIYMMRRISLVVASAAMLAVSALPASAAMASTPHKLSFPAVSGLKAWGTYTKVAKGIKLNVCAQDTSKSTYAVGAVALASNSTYKMHTNLGAVAFGDHADHLPHHDPALHLAPAGVLDLVEQQGHDHPQDQAEDDLLSADHPEAGRGGTPRPAFACQRKRRA